MRRVNVGFTAMVLLIMLVVPVISGCEQGAVRKTDPNFVISRDAFDSLSAEQQAEYNRQLVLTEPIATIVDKAVNIGGPLLKLAKPVASLVPYGEQAAWGLSGLLLMWLKFRPKLVALKEVTEGIHNTRRIDTNTGKMVLNKGLAASLSGATTDKSKKVIAKLEGKMTVKSPSSETVV